MPLNLNSTVRAPWCCSGPNEHSLPRHWLLNSINKSSKVNSLAVFYHFILNSPSLSHEWKLHKAGKKIWLTGGRTSAVKGLAKWEQTNEQNMTVLLYGLEVCLLNKSDYSSLDFAINRFFMKLFKTNNISLRQLFFRCELPSAILQRRYETFCSNISDRQL